MTQSVVALLHGVAPGAEDGVLGYLSGAFARCGHDIAARSFTGEGRPPRLSLEGVRMLVVMGALDSCTDDSLPWIDDESRYVASAISRGVPVLGICFGAQLLASVTGGKVVPGGAVERGLVDVRSADRDRIPEGDWYAHHRDRIVPPAEADVLASNDTAVQAFALGPHLGVQFHPEVRPDTLDVWRASFSGTNAALSADDPQWEGDRTALQEAGPDLARRTGTLVRGFVRSAQRHLAAAV